MLRATSNFEFYRERTGKGLRRCRGAMMGFALFWRCWRTSSLVGRAGAYRLVLERAGATQRRSPARARPYFLFASLSCVRCWMRERLTSRASPPGDVDDGAPAVGFAYAAPG